MDGNKQHASGGFLFGVVVGVVLALLFTTKKGREILRMLTDEGLNKFADLEDVLQEKVREVEEDADDEDFNNADYVAPVEREEVMSAPQEEPKKTLPSVKSETHISEAPASEEHEKKRTTKRFFRKSK